MLFVVNLSLQIGEEFWSLTMVAPKNLILKVPKPWAVARSILIDQLEGKIELKREKGTELRIRLNVENKL